MFPQFKRFHIQVTQHSLGSTARWATIYSYFCIKQHYEKSLVGQMTAWLHLLSSYLAVFILPWTSWRAWISCTIFLPDTVASSCFKESICFPIAPNHDWRFSVRVQLKSYRDYRVWKYTLIFPNWIVFNFTWLIGFDTNCCKCKFNIMKTINSTDLILY